MNLEIIVKEYIEKNHDKYIIQYNTPNSIIFYRPNQKIFKRSKRKNIFRNIKYRI